MSIIIFNKKPRLKDKIVKGKGVKAPKSVELEVRRAIDKFMMPVYAQLDDWTNRFIVNFNTQRVTAKQAAEQLRSYQYTFDDYARRQAPYIATNWTQSVNDINLKRTQKSLGDRLGVDVAAILEEDAVKATLGIMLEESTDLIRTIPHDLIGNIAKRVLQYYKGEMMPEGRTLSQQIQEEFNISANRARVIARDQTSKLNGNLNAVRQMNLGIEKYIWRTAGDNRVVGNPVGLYPKGNRMHGNHYERNGKMFEWAKPPEDGHPGEAIQCRCYAEPLIDINKLKAKWV